MADNEDSDNNKNKNNDNKSKSNRKTKIPMPGLNPGALVFHQGRSTHIEPYHNKVAPNEHQHTTQGYAPPSFETKRTLHPYHMPHPNAPQHAYAWSPSHSNPHLNLHPQTQHCLTSTVAYSPHHLAPYFSAQYNEHHLASYFPASANTYAHAFASQLHTIHRTLHARPARSYARGYGCEAAAPRVVVGATSDGGGADINTGAGIDTKKKMGKGKKWWKGGKGAKGKKGEGLVKEDEDEDEDEG
ncbi:hypothetical protein J1614_001118 [Plenodomus biglobosus]|nr:hypothetical protein J1614_001118 [Plenodomus biglobosus]